MGRGRQCYFVPQWEGIAKNPPPDFWWFGNWVHDRCLCVSVRGSDSSRSDPPPCGGRWPHRGVLCGRGPLRPRGGASLTPFPNPCRWRVPLGVGPRASFVEPVNTLANRQILYFEISHRPGGGGGGNTLRKEIRLFFSLCVNGGKI